MIVTHARLFFVLAIFTAIGVTTLPTLGASSDGLSASMKSDLACAVAALKTIQGVDQVEVGVLNRVSPGETRNSAWVHPFIDYRYVDAGGRTNKVRFEAYHGGRKKVLFMTMLPGLFSPAEKGPPDYGANKAIKIWKARCGLDGNILFE